PSGKVEPYELMSRFSYDPVKAFQITWKGTRLDGREDLPWGLRTSSPLQAAIAAGGAIGDGTAFGVVHGAVLRVDLSTGELVSMSSDWTTNGLACQPVRAEDGVLFACSWDRVYGYGGYVLRSTMGAPPVLEKAFSDDGSFVADDDGAIGYL